MKILERVLETLKTMTPEEYAELVKDTENNFNPENRSPCPHVEKKNVSEGFEEWWKYCCNNFWPDVSTPDTAARRAWNSALASQESRWISVSDRLPEVNVPVLCAVISGYDGKLYVCALCRKEETYDEWLWCICNTSSNLEDASCYEADDDYDVKYWQPLPPPPKDGA
jgi:hypothetical protein